MYPRPVLLWLTAGFFRFWEPQPAVPSMQVEAALSSNPVLLYSVVIPGSPPESATRAEPAPAVVDGDQIFVGSSGNNSLLVLDRRDGRLAGVLPANAAVGAGAIVTADRVWFSDSAGYTWCYQRPTTEAAFRNIQPIWSHYSGAPVASSPVLDGGVLYLTNVNELVYALDAATGELRWRHAHVLDASRGASLELFGAPSPTVSEDTVYAGFSDGFLVNLSRADGSERWRTGVGEGTYPDLIAPAAPAGDAVIVGGFTEPLLAIDPLTRAVRWRVEAGTAAPLTLDQDTIWQGGSDGVLRKIETRTGNVLWSWTAPITGTLTQPTPTPMGVLVASSAGSVYLVDATTGATNWAFDPGFLLAGVTGRPAVSGDTLYVVTNAGRLYAFRGRQPKPLLVKGS